LRALKSVAVIVALAIYMRAKVRIGLGPGKTELILPPRCDPQAVLHQLDAYREEFPHIVPGFGACLGVPRHANNDPELIVAFVERLGVRNNRLLDLVEAVANDDPFDALRLLHICGV
jgi:hypothetical protein